MSDNKWSKKVREDLLYQIWWAETNQEEKEIEERKKNNLNTEKFNKHIKLYTQWKINYLKKFLN
jgi:hypothetical protein|tara:strand:+ start:143 stop:334 length:192 start_codon:yes stop_codon:yes gene_type:complete